MKPLAIAQGHRGTGRWFGPSLPVFLTPTLPCSGPCWPCNHQGSKQFFPLSPVIPECGWYTGSVVTLLPLNKEWKVWGIETGTRKEVRLVNKPQNSLVVGTLHEWLCGYNLRTTSCLVAQADCTPQPGVTRSYNDLTEGVMDRHPDLPDTSIPSRNPEACQLSSLCNRLF